MIPLVCYSNSDYLDVLTVQNAFLQSFNGPMVLLTNQVPKIPLRFDTVILYDNTLNYSKRVLQGLLQLDSEFILFYHDIDILLRYSPNEVMELVHCMQKSGIDRIDLQYSTLKEEDSIQWKDMYLTRSDSYVYNVNPSIWRRSVLIDIMTQFDKSYRAIEDTEMQLYCQRFNIFKMWSQTKVHAGYFHTTPLFVFLHLTHGGKLPPQDSNTMEKWIETIYRGILVSFTLQREMRKTLH
jgi:hypothetical protein